MDCECRTWTVENILTATWWGREHHPRCPSRPPAPPVTLPGMDSEPTPGVTDDEVLQAFGLARDILLSDTMRAELRTQYNLAVANGTLNRLAAGPQREISRRQLDAALDDIVEYCPHCPLARRVVLPYPDDIIELLRRLGICVVD